MKKLKILLTLALPLVGCSTAPLITRDTASLSDCNELIKNFISSNKAKGVVALETSALSFKPKRGQQTLKTSSGIEIEGNFTTFKSDSDEEIFYYGTTGPTQLKYEGKVIPGQDTKQHAQGFSSPLGNLRGIKKPLEDLNAKELKKIGIEEGQDVRLEYESGVVVQGKLKNIVREKGKNIIFTFENETTEVAAPDGTLLFERSWGVYDMVIGKAFVDSKENAHVPYDIIQTTIKKLKEEDSRVSQSIKWEVEGHEISALKKFTLGDPEGLEYVTAAEKAAKESRPEGETLDEYALVEGFEPLQLKSFKGLETLPGQSSNNGAEVMVYITSRLKNAPKKSAELRGVIINSYEAGFDLVDTFGVIHHINNNHVSFNVAYLRPYKSSADSHVSAQTLKETYEKINKRDEWYERKPKKLDDGLKNAGIDELKEAETMAKQSRPKDESLQVYAQREGFKLIKDRNIRGVKVLNGKKDNIGLEVIVQFISNKKPVELRGVIVRNYDAGFSLVDTRGFIHEINSNHFQMIEAYAREYRP